MLKYLKIMKSKKAVAYLNNEIIFSVFRIPKITFVSLTINLN